MRRVDLFWIDDSSLLTKQSLTPFWGEAFLNLYGLEERYTNGIVLKDAGPVYHEIQDIKGREKEVFCRLGILRKIGSRVRA